MTQLLNILHRHPGERTALIESRQDHPEAALSYGALIAHAHALRQVLPARTGGSSTPVVAVLSGHPLHQAAGIVAALAGGMIVNVVNPALPPAMQRGQLLHARPDLLIVDGAENPPADLPGTIRTVRWKRLFMEAAATAPLPEDGDRGDGGLLIYTSGTTGAPKGVLLPWSHISANVLHAISTLEMTPGWTAGSLLPRFHSFTLISDIFPALLLGGRAVITDSFDLEHAQHIVDAFRRHGVQSYSAAPVILEACCALNAWHNVPSLRFTVAGAAPLKEKTRAEYAALFGHPIVPCYGLTETTCFAAMSPPGAIRPQAVGLPAGIEIRTLGDDGTPLPAGAAGELAMRGPSVIRERYFRDVEGRFADAFTPDGWFRSGDIGRIDAAGYVHVTGRKKNMVIRGGEKIHLEDVDRCLADLPGIKDCASVALCRPQGVDLALSFIVVEPGAAIPRARIGERIRKILTPRHVPDRLYFIEQIPRTRSGKAAIPELLALAHDFEAVGEAPR